MEEEKQCEEQCEDLRVIDEFINDTEEIPEVDNQDELLAMAINHEYLKNNEREAEVEYLEKLNKE